MARSIEDTIAHADQHPSSLEAQIAAAYACDGAGRESEAIVFYDRAASIGVGSDQRREFLVGYGSTLRNVGRLEESESILRDAITSEPSYAAYHAFLGLTLHDRGRHREAVTALLHCAIIGGADLDGYERALSSYRDELDHGE